MRWLLVAIAALAICAAAFVAIVTEPTHAPSSSPERAAGDAGAAPSLSPTGGEGWGEGAGGPRSLEQASAAGANLAAPRPSGPSEDEGASEDGTVRALPRDPNARRAALDPLKREVFAGLAELRGRIAHCDVSGWTVHVTLETTEGGVRIAEARLASPADDEARDGVDATTAEGDALHCVRSALERNVIGAPSARPGRRWEMQLEPGEIEEPARRE